jgi:type IV pilus assembly protein PilQ
MKRKVAAMKNTITIIKTTALALLMSVATGAVAAGNSLESISYSSLPGDRLQISLTMAQPASEPLSFTIDDPARISLDFADTKSNLARKNQTIGIGVARSVSAVEANNKTRVVLNLISLVPYAVSVDGNKVNVILNQQGKANSRSGSSAAKAPTPGRTLEQIDFRRGEQGEGRVLVNLSTPAIGVDVRKEGRHIIVDFIDAALPEALERKLDVVDFATPVRNIETYAQGNNVRMVVEPMTDEFEHLAYQSDTLFSLDLRPLSRAEQEKRQKEKFGYSGEKLSLNFQDIEVRAVLQLLADFAGFNLVTSDTVIGNVTLRLKNVPWDQAMDIILKTKGLSKRKTGNVVLVAPTEEIAQREQLELESQAKIQELAPLRTEVIELSYANAVEIVDLIEQTTEDQQGGGGGEDTALSPSLLSPRGYAIGDERTNTLLIQDTAEKIEQIRKLVETLDVPIRQVLVESRIVIANNDFSKDLGVRFGFSRHDFNADYSRTDTLSGNLEGVRELVNGDPLTQTNALNVNLPASPSTGTAATIGLAIARLPFGHLLQLELSALQAEGRGEVISSPRVITANGKAAYIEQGTELPYLEATTSGAASVTFKKAVLSLKVKPQITPDNSVIMDLLVTQDTVGQLVLLLGSSIPSIDTREVGTRVLVENGETVVLGGVYTQNKSNTVQRVPFLGELPYVGWLFRTRNETNNKDELLIFVTPKILDDNLRTTTAELNY